MVEALIATLDQPSDPWPARRIQVIVIVGALILTMVLVPTNNATALDRDGLIGKIVARTGLERAEASRAVDAFIEIVKETLAAGDSVSIMGFGAFSVRKRAARTGRNPRTGEAIYIPPSKMPTFKAGDALRDAIN